MAAVSGLGWGWAEGHVPDGQGLRGVQRRTVRPSSCPSTVTVYMSTGIYRSHRSALGRGLLKFIFIVAIVHGLNYTQWLYDMVMVIQSPGQ